MRKDFGAKPFIYPCPVFIIASYDENNNPDAMNAAWGCIADYKQIALYLASEHKTVKNILHKKAFTVSMADAKHVKEVDYLGIVSGNKVPDKLKKANLHPIKSNLVDAPIIEEFLMTLECKLISYDKESELLLGEIVNVSIDESVLDENGKVDVDRLEPITFDPVNNTYRKLGALTGQAFKDGNQIK